MNQKLKKKKSASLLFSIILFLLTACLYTLMTYGGIRSPDSEIVYRLCESLGSRASVSVEEIETWPGFGVAQGREGKKYPVFGPAESYLAVPFYLLARQVEPTAWYEQLYYLPPSHYCTDGITAFATGHKPYDQRQHARRLIVSLFNILVSTIAVLVFWFIMLQLLGDLASALSAALVFAFGTMFWPYSGTFFSEPLATLFVLLSLHQLVCFDTASAKGLTPKKLHFLFSGIFLGLATCTHISAILFAPFFITWAVYLAYRYDPSRGTSSSAKHPIKTLIPSLAIYLSGFGSLLLLLGFYNFYRFGNFLETGRTVDALAKKYFFYGTFTLSFKNLYGLLFGSGKGLLLFSPAIVLGLLGWYYFHKEKKVLSFIFIGVAVTRILFIAFRSDWHGGFSLGPRYLLMLLPILIIPFGFVVKKFLSQGNSRHLLLLAFYAFFCVSQQVFFCIGEIFSFFHGIKWQCSAQGIDILKNDRLYLDWEFSPIYHLLKGKRGPFLLQGIDISNGSLWLILLLLVNIIIAGVLVLLFVKNKRQKLVK